MLEIQGHAATLDIADVERFVLFVDILGFAGLVEKVSATSNLLPVFASSNDTPLPTLRQVLGGDRGKLGAQFAGFHRVLKLHVSDYSDEGLTVVSFSDSAFLSVQAFEPMRRIASSMMRGMLEAEVPVRMGLAAGSFKGLRF